MNKVKTDNVVDTEIQQEVKKLLRNISNGVSKLSISKFNRILSQVITKYTSNSDDIDAIMKIICSHFNITEETLYNSKSKGDVYTAKLIAFKIMNTTLGVSASDIGKKFNRYQNSVSYAIKKFHGLEPKKRADDRKIMDDYTSIMLDVKKYTNSKIIE